MHLRPTLRRRSPRRRLVAAAVLAVTAGSATALFAVGPAAPVRSAAQTPLICVSPLLTCTPPPATSGTGQPTGSGSHTAKPPATSGSPPTTSAPATPGDTNPGYVRPSGGALPTLPPPSPGSPPQPPELAVQTISLQLASAPPSKPGATVLVQATLEARRGADTYAVPHASVSFSIVWSAGRGANAVPAQLDSGDTGVVVVDVVTGDRPGDTVVRAVSGNASADLTVHADAQSVAPPAPSTTPVRTTPGTNTPASRGLLVAGLAGLIVALLAGYVTALAMGRLPNPLQRRSVWGRRSSSGR
jgi:hypothetical protein